MDGVKIGKKIIFIVLFTLFCSTKIQAQNFGDSPRFIEVTGSSELEIAPDEIRFIICIEEYWKEEFEKNSEFKDYKTKTPISEIEEELMKDLNHIGIKNDRIITKEIGNYKRFKGKEFLIRKNFEITLDHFNQIDGIISKINTKGIAYMRIGELINKNMTEHRKQVKISALKAAKNKADYLLNSIGKKTGDVLSIMELENENSWNPRSLASNTVMPPTGEPDSFRKIKLRYEIRVRFEIN